MSKDPVRYFGNIEQLEPMENWLPGRRIGYASGYKDKECHFTNRDFLDWDGHWGDENPPVVGQQVSFWVSVTPGRYYAADIRREPAE